MLDLFGHGVNLLLLLSNHCVHIFHLNIAFILLFLEHDVVLLNLMQNFLGFVFPLKVNLSQLIDLTDFILFEFLVFINLLLKDFQVYRRLSNNLLVLAYVRLIIDLKTLNFFVKLVTFDLIISYSFIGDSEFLLAILVFLLTLIYLLLQVLYSFLITMAVVFERSHSVLLIVHLLLEHAFPAIQLLNSLNLLLLAFKRVLRQDAVLAKVLNDLVIVRHLRLLVIVLKQFQDVCPIIVRLLAHLNEINHELGLAL